MGARADPRARTRTRARTGSGTWARTRPGPGPGSGPGPGPGPGPGQCQGHDQGQDQDRDQDGDQGQYNMYILNTYMNMFTFPYIWHRFLHLVTHPRLQSTPLDPHRKVSAPAPSFRLNCDAKNNLWPIMFQNSVGSWIMQIIICKWVNLVYICFFM